MIGAWGAFVQSNYEALGEGPADRALAGVGQTVMINLVLGLSSRQIDNMGHLGVSCLGSPAPLSLTLWVHSATSKCCSQGTKIGML
ncbi:unnamed protein product [Discosporangium mesarthrocarpum]